MLDHDRVLRGYLALILATLRTNYFAARITRPPPPPPPPPPPDRRRCRRWHD